IAPSLAPVQTPVFAPLRNHAISNRRAKGGLRRTGTLNHRLVQMCLRLLRAEIWSLGTQAKHLSRVSACVVDDSALTHPVVIAHGRIVVLGGDNHRLHEEIITAGGALIEGRFSRLNVGEI